jgi:hypothetical protein
MAQGRAREEPVPPRSADPVGVSDRPVDDDLDEQEAESFPASDPHSDWAGPAT